MVTPEEEERLRALIQGLAGEGGDAALAGILDPIAAGDRTEMVERAAQYLIKRYGLGAALRAEQLAARRPGEIAELVKERVAILLDEGRD